MKLYTLWKQYPQSYPGELMPDCTDVITEYANEDNPDWFENKVAQAKQEVNDGTIESWRVMLLEVPEAEVVRAFLPAEVIADVVRAANPFEEDKPAGANLRITGGGNLG